jgi:hypothetical protein
LRVELNALFNLAIAEELDGDPQAAVDRMQTVGSRAASANLTDLYCWAQIRECWLTLRLGRVDRARLILNDLLGLGDPYRDSVNTLIAFLGRADGAAASAYRKFGTLAAAYALREDWLTAFVLYLWAAVAGEEAGQIRAAKRAATTACEIGQARNFRLSPNWWSGELAATAMRLQPARAAYLSTWIACHGLLGKGRAPRVDVYGDGRIAIDSVFDQDQWTSRRTGSRLLHRYFLCLLAAYPDDVPREALEDRLWPDSDGDHASANLQVAAKELRRALARVPGLRVATASRRHRLLADDNVHLHGVPTWPHTPSL